METDHLGRKVRGVRIVHDITLEVRAGDVVAVLGASGAGKPSSPARLRVSTNQQTERALLGRQRQIVRPCSQVGAM